MWNQQVGKPKCKVLSQSLKQFDNPLYFTLHEKKKWVYRSNRNWNSICEIVISELILFSYTTDCWVFFLLLFFSSIRRDACFPRQDAETLKQIAQKGNLFCLELFWASQLNVNSRLIYCFLLCYFKVYK